MESSHENRTPHSFGRVSIPWANWLASRFAEAIASHLFSAVMERGGDAADSNRYGRMIDPGMVATDLFRWSSFYRCCRPAAYCSMVRTGSRPQHALSSTSRGLATKPRQVSVKWYIRECPAVRSPTLVWNARLNRSIVTKRWLEYEYINR